MKEINLDFNLNEKELECLEIHSLFKQKGVYENLEYEDLTDVDKIKVWYDSSYNDNWYDIEPVYFDLIKNDEVINKFSARLYSELEIRKDVEEGNMLSFIITPKMLK